MAYTINYLPFELGFKTFDNLPFGNCNNLAKQFQSSMFIIWFAKFWVYQKELRAKPSENCVCNKNT